MRRWIHPKYAFFLPVDVLSSVFRAKFVRRIAKGVQQADDLTFPGSIAQLAEPETLCRFCRFTLPATVGRIRQASIRRTHPGASLSWPVHASCRHQQSPLVGLRWRARHLPLERLRAWQQAAEDDPFSNGVSAPLYPAHSAREASSASGSSDILTNTRRSALLALARRLLTAAPRYPRLAQRKPPRVPPGGVRIATAKCGSDPISPLTNWNPSADLSTARRPGHTLWPNHVPSCAAALVSSPPPD